MNIFFGLLGNFLQLPIPVKILIEMSFILLALTIVWPLVRFILTLTIRLIRIIHKILLGMVRFLVCKLFAKNANIYTWDEKIGERGCKTDNYLSVKAEEIKTVKAKAILTKKSSIVLIVLIYIFAILPILGLNNIVDEYYIEPLYIVNGFFGKIERCMADKASGYPLLFKITEKSEEEIQEEESFESEKPERIYLLLGDDIYYANVREDAGKNEIQVCVVSREDSILYLNEYKINEGRFWLRIMVESQGDIKGWISEMVLDTDIVETLDLQ